MKEFGKVHFELSLLIPMKANYTLDPTNEQDIVKGPKYVTEAPE